MGNIVFSKQMWTGVCGKPPNRGKVPVLVEEKVIEKKPHCKISSWLDPGLSPSSPSASPPHSYPLQRSKNVHCCSGCVRSPSVSAGRIVCTSVLVARRPGQRQSFLTPSSPWPSSSWSIQSTMEQEAAEGRRDVWRPAPEGGRAGLALSEGALGGWGAPSHSAGAVRHPEGEAAQMKKVLLQLRGQAVKVPVIAVALAEPAPPQTVLLPPE